MTESTESAGNYYHNDQWSVADELGLSDAAERLARMTLQVSPPFSISVNGKWGSGKTSIMRRAFVTLGGRPTSQAVLLGEEKQESDHHEYNWDISLLREDGKVNQRRKLALRRTANWEDADFNAAASSLLVWYSPWQHQNAENPLVPLLMEVRNQFQARYKLLDQSKRLVRQGGLASLTLLERAIDAALAIGVGTSTGAGTNFEVAGGTTEAVRKAWNAADDRPQLSDGPRFHLQFEDAVETSLKSLDGKSTGALDSKARLIVFIDDLDRCEESTIVNLLEAIKLYLGTSRCVFVLGLDNNAILHALGNHWSSRSEDYNREYLEKLFQATIRVPSPQPAKAKQLIEKQLQAHDIPTARHFAEVICGLIEPNPRKLKNFTNSVCATWCLHNIPHAETQSEPSVGVVSNNSILQLILMQYLVLYHPTIWRILERQPWTLKILFAVLTGTETDSQQLPGSFSDADQHIMKHFFARSFSHVLRHNSKIDEPRQESEDKHRGLALDAAVDLFLERIDRKHSDEFFIQCLKIAFARGDELPVHLLTLGGGV